MSDLIDRSPLTDSATPSRRGQSLVEFALVLPILLVLLLGIADFGRVFQAGIIAEAAARNAAEIVAEEYRRNPPGGSLSDPVPSPGDPDYYGPLHELGALTVCAEMRTLPSTRYDPVTRGCHVADGDPNTHDGMPVVLVCIHDGVDPLCENPGFGADIPDPECSALLEPIGPAIAGEAYGEDSKYVEVRVCYQFKTLVNVGLLSLGDIWLQKDRTFTVADYPLPTPSVPPAASAPPAEELPATPTPEPSVSATPSSSAETSPTPTPAESTSAVPLPTPLAETPVPTPAPTPTTGPTATPSPTP